MSLDPRFLRLPEAFAGFMDCFFFWLEQVGSYFVRQYYQVLQQQPDFVHQFYTDLSTMMHIDGSATETASGMLVIMV